MKSLLLLGLTPLALAMPAAAQDHSMHGMPGMKMPAKPAPAKAKPRPAVTPKAKPRPKTVPKPKARARAAAPVRKPRAAPATDPHSGHDMSAMPQAPTPGPHAGHDMSTMQQAQVQDPHAGHDMSAMGQAAPAADPHAGHDMAAMDAPQGAQASGTDLPAGSGTAPAPEPGRAADRYWGAAAMDAAERIVRREHGDMPYGKVMLDLAELRVQPGGTGYRWEGEASYGGDINRFWIKSEGEGVFRKGLETAEVQALYSRAVDPYWNLQAGLRQDLGPGARRTYAALGVEGLAPYWFDVGATIFLSDKGDLLARAEATYDQRITQDLVLQPRIEFNLAAQDMPAERVGAGLSTAEAGLRLRYERVREFAPYVGVSWERSLGRTADLARARGDRTGGVSFVMGVRAWF